MRKVTFFCLVILFAEIFLIGCGESDRKKWLTAMSDIRAICNPIESYLTDHRDEAPQVDGIEKLKKILEPEYIKGLPLKDPWGNAYIYKYDRNDKSGYYIMCTGTDGKIIKGSGDDLILSNGAFIVAPKILQRKKTKRR